MRHLKKLRYFLYLFYVFFIYIHMLFFFKILWGTTVNTSDTLRSISDFFNENSSYSEQITQGRNTSVDIDCKDLCRFRPVLYKELVCYPTEMIPYFDFSINHQRKHAAKHDDNDVKVQARFYNMYETKSISLFNPDDIDCLVAIKGIVTRCSAVIPELHRAFFQCCLCNKYVIPHCR